MIVENLWLLPLGLSASVFGTLVGAGGGVVAVPVLLLALPDLGVADITQTGLFLVAVNSTLATVSYSRQRRVHFAGGLRFAAAAVPGSALGVMVARRTGMGLFSGLFGACLCVIAGLIAYRVLRRDWKDRENIPAPDARGMSASAAVGFLSSFFGFGGGAIHVPILIEWLGYPTRIATATSHLVLAITSGVGLLTHLLSGGLPAQPLNALLLVAGAAIGSPVGAWLSLRISSRAVLLLLAGALFLLGGRVMFR